MVVLCLPIKGMVQIASTQSTNTVNAPTYMQRICIGGEKQMKLSHTLNSLGMVNVKQNQA